ncbi:MAG: hypothetical protein OXI01_16915 [Albidovulum sp.]|nr:hypothetical protein [Albidovulum sp.]
MQDYSTDNIADAAMMSNDPLLGSPERLVPPDKPKLTPEDVKEKTSGNYLFSFGFPGSGKTTFQWMMMNYLMNEGPFHPKIQVPDRANGPDWEGRGIINSWKNQWIEGRFPDSTPAGERNVREVMVHAHTTAGKKLAVDFSFLEASGELMHTVIPGYPEAGKSPELTPLLRAYLENPRLKFVVLLMLSPDIEENDQLFPSFVSYLDQNFRGLRDRMSLGVIVTKPRESLRRLRKFGASDGSKDFPEFDEKTLEAYVNRFCGETYQIWESWPYPKKTLLSSLYIGEIEMIEGEQRLVKPDFHHIGEIFFWVFEQFTGKRPGPTPWQRFTGRLDSK